MLHQPCDLRRRDRYNRCNHNQFDLLCNRKRLQQAHRRNNRRDRHNNQHLRVRDQRHRVRGQFRHHQVHRDRFRHRQLLVDQRVA